MARVAGIEIPANKPAWVALTYVFGVGATLARKILKEAGVPEQELRQVVEESLEEILGKARPAAPAPSLPADVAAAETLSDGITFTTITKAVSAKRTKKNFPRTAISPKKMQVVDNFTDQEKASTKLTNLESALSESEEAERKRSEEQEKKRQEEENTRNRQREFSGAISMILVGIPLYLYHWKTIQKENKS